MDLENPLRSVAPSVEADVLAVLARTHAPLTGRRIQQLADRSYGRVRLVLQRLVDHGLVLAEQHGNARSYVLNREHVLSGPLESMATANATIEDEARARIALFTVPPVAVMAFGSFARRDGDASSDIDILLVRPDTVDADQESWNTQRDSLIDGLERRAGNRVQIVELSEAELNDAVTRDEPLVTPLRREAVLLGGTLPSPLWHDLRGHS